jgi:hypothetical protein
MRFRRSWTLAAALAFAASAARAAEVTEVADAFDEKKPFEIDLRFSYWHLQRDTKLTRENLQGGTVNLVDELQHAQTVDELAFRLAVGIFRDLEVHVIAPLVLRDLQTWDYAIVNGVSVAGASTLRNNRIDISGCLAPGSCAAVSPIVQVPGRTLRGGFRDPTVGIAWAPINEERERALRPELYPPGKPVSTWVLALDYTLPLPGEVDDPSRITAARGHELHKAHVFTLWTAFSKRFRVLDPYLVVRASAPLAVKSSGPGSGAYQNCWHPEQLSDVAAVNCADPAWKNDTGYSPPYEAGFTLGTELVLHEEPAARQKVVIDVRGDVRYVGQQRGYTQIADALGKLTYAEEFVAGSGSIGVNARAARWLQARVAGSIGIESPHFITSEAIGKDLNGDGRITLSNGTASGSREQSPTYDFRLDQVGRRLRAEAAVVWGISGTLALSF